MSVQFADSSSKPSVAELASFANKAREMDIGGADDIVELGDDLGVSLLANPSRMPASPKTGGRQISFGSASGSGSGGYGSGPSSASGFGSGSDMPQINIKPLDDLEVVNLDGGAPNASNIQINRDADSAPFVINTGGDTIPLDSGNGGGMSQEEETRQKQQLLTKLRRLDNDGVGGQRVSMGNSLEEIKQEYENRTDSKNLEASIRFQRNALMTFVSGVELVNDKVGHRLPVKPRLKGWSESVHTNISDFDDIFEELYDLYKDKAKMHPLLRLVGTLGVSATMYHLTNSMAERSGIPGMSDLLHENPELQRQFAAAAAAKMGGLGNFMQAAGGMGSGFGGPGGGGGAGPDPMAMGMGVPPPSPPRQASSGRTPFNMASNATVPSADEAPKARREMRGPTGVDDILKAFEAERMIQANTNPISGHNAGVFTPSGKPPTPPRTMNVLREGVGSMSDPMADFLAGMDDGASIGSGSTMNTERRRGRRRAVATPVGATLNLNV